MTFEQIDRLFGAAILAVLALGVAFVVWAVSSENESDARFMAECQADGRKRYECEALLNGSKPQVVPMPVVVPVHR
ncbi:MAG TPA: hypothetical protein VJN18_35725 [Polyangiaceae bacterium]|nr:hypothetical protein [Polyangiaceae bacterium]